MGPLVNAGRREKWEELDSTVILENQDQKVFMVATELMAFQEYQGSMEKLEIRYCNCTLHCLSSCMCWWAVIKHHCFKCDPITYCRAQKVLLVTRETLVQKEIPYVSCVHEKIHSIWDCLKSKFIGECKQDKLLADNFIHVYYLYCINTLLNN